MAMILPQRSVSHFSGERQAVGGTGAKQEMCKRRCADQV
jgi:hypothetical protein